MTFLILNIVFVPSLLLSKHLFKKWINPISIYAIIWYFMLSLYEAKLFQYSDLSFVTWFVIGSAYISFILGIVTYFTARESFNPEYQQALVSTNIFEITEKKEQILKYIIIVCGSIGLFGALQHWGVLFNNYGSLTNILLSAQDIYRERVSGELIGVIPYLATFSFVSIFFAGILCGYLNKFSLYALIPIFAVILKELANISRAGMLFGILEFVFTIILFRFFYIRKKDDKNYNNKKLIIGLLLLFTFIVVAATIVRSVKGSVEHYQSSTRTLDKLNENIVITPSIYLYFSAHVGVLNKYLEKDEEEARIGENTFMPIYRVLNKLGVSDKPKTYQRGYYIPMWVNTGTYLRELSVDFGIIGILLLPYLFGLFVSFIWNKLSEEFSLFYLILLVYSFIIISFSYVVMISRLGNFLISLILLILFIPFLRAEQNE